MAKLTKSEKIAIKERLRELIDAKLKKFGRHKNSEFAKELGVLARRVSEWTGEDPSRYPNFEDLRKIEEVFRARYDYMRFGNGTMFEENTNTENEKTDKDEEVKLLTEADFNRILLKSQEQIDKSQRQIDRFQDQIDSIIQLAREQQWTINVQQSTISELTHKITGKKEEKKRRRVIINCKEPAPHRCN